MIVAISIMTSRSGSRPVISKSIHTKNLFVAISIFLLYTLEFKRIYLINFINLHKYQPRQTIQAYSLRNLSMSKRKLTRRQAWRINKIQQEKIERAQKKDSAINDRKSTRLNSSHVRISYAVFCLKKKIKKTKNHQ